MARSRRSWPCALTIAGSDSGGGAGIQADLKTFAALRVHGACAVTCLTAQDPTGVHAVQAARPSVVRAQIDAIFRELRPAAVKTGMLHSASIVRTVAEALSAHPGIPLVVDPVMVASSGACLMDAAAFRLLRLRLLPRATILTPNLDEAARLLGRRLRALEDLRAAARELQHRFGGAVLVKGGHLRRLPAAVDFFFDGREELMLEAPRVRGVSTHGTGCTISAAIAAYLARGESLRRAVIQAKTYLFEAIAGSVRVGGHDVLGIPAEPA